MSGIATLKGLVVNVHIVVMDTVNGLRHNIETVSIARYCVQFKLLCIMSLFNVCSWWRAQCGDSTGDYDVASLLCARFGLETQEKDYIVVGSQGGQLSIFYPHDKAYDATDLLLETQLAAPILGLYAGKFSG